MDGKGISALVIAVTIGAVFFVPVVDIIDTNSGEVEIENETVTTDANFDDTFSLAGYEIVEGSETVERYDEVDESWVLLDAGTDYELTNEAGEIEFLSEGAVEEGDEVRASYTYEATDGITSSIVNLIPVFLALLLLVPMANKVSEGV